MKTLFLLIITSLSFAYCQSSIPYIYDAAAWSYPTYYLSTDFLMNEGMLKKQGILSDSIVYEANSKLGACYVWHFDQNGNVIYYAYYSTPAEQPLYREYAQYDSHGNMIEHKLVDANNSLVEKKIYSYDTNGRVTSFKNFPGTELIQKWDFRINYESDTVFTIINEMPNGQGVVWAWKYTLGPYNNVIALAELDSNGTILHSSRISKSNSTGILCKDSISKRTIQTFSSNTNDVYYRIERTYLDQHQPEIFVPISNGDSLDTQNANVTWTIKKSDVLIEEKKYDRNDKLFNHTKYYNEFTISLKSSDTKPDRIVYKTEEIYNPSGQTECYLTYFKGGFSRMQYFYNSKGLLERIDYYVNKKLHHKVHYFSF